MAGLQSTAMSGGGVRVIAFGRIEIVTFLWIFCALVTVVVSQHQNTFFMHGRYGKRAETYAQASPFFSGSRYGRGGGTTNSRGSKSESKILEVSPRMDRFFPGSRYGKRVPDDNDDNNLQQRQLLAKITPINGIVEALGYFDRAIDTDRYAKSIDNPREMTSSEKIDRYNGNEEKTSNEILNKDELDNFW